MRMERLLRAKVSNQKAVHFSGLEANRVEQALENLAYSLRHAITLFESSSAAAAGGGAPSSKTKDASDTGAPKISASWLLRLCESVSLEIEPLFVAQSILEASSLTDPAQQQAALFDILGASDDAINLLTQVLPFMDQIRKISLDSLHAGSSSAQYEDMVDLEEERKQLLLHEAYEASQVARIAQAEVDQLQGQGNATHTIMRESHLQAIKLAKKAQERAAKALKRARDAGALLEEDDLLRVDRTSLGDGGLMNKTPDELISLRHALLPEGSRQYYDQRGLPRGATDETDRDGTRIVKIPAPQRDESNLPARLRIQDIMDEECAKAFAGTVSLNPMQSAVFQVAFHNRDNMLVCAPTGAGKTNVAMLAVVAHFRDVGLIGDADVIDTATKVVYIAPMKALAQEVVEKFSSKLKPLGLVVREYTGDMQLTRAEAESANVLVTTPEKWDVVTRKSGTDDTSLGAQCGLLIIDEVHLLADERGAVIESVVSRLHRFVEARQRQVRIVALSATLPNYDDVAEFLQVPERGLFFFGPEHRPVPLEQTFIGVNVKERASRQEKEDKMNSVCYDIVLDNLKRGYQVMVFVHSRKGTGDTASALAQLASEDGTLETFFVTQAKEGPIGAAHKRYADRVKKSRNREVGIHFENGMGIHHAGMLRGDRKLTEQMFADGAIRVLCCTATLAWGINMNVHASIIKGTEVYNPEKGGNVDLSILDVQQIFGRAGRPQFDTSGEAALITTKEALTRYLDKLARAVPIESNFIRQLPDHLNAEVVGSTVTNIDEAARWLTYTYLYVRMCRNPIGYGISADEKADDPLLRGRCRELVINAAKNLDESGMVKYDQKTGHLTARESGRIAAHFYIQTESVATFRESLLRKALPTDVDVMRLVAAATEFKNMKVRQEELDELQGLRRDGNACPIVYDGPGRESDGKALVADEIDKVSILMQAYISRARIRGFTLITDVNYIATNAGRIARAEFEMCLKASRAPPALRFLRLAKSIENRSWFFQTPLRHFSEELSEDVLKAVDRALGGGNDVLEATLSLLDMQPLEVGQLCNRAKGGELIQSFIRMLPILDVSCQIQPVTSQVVRFHVVITPAFKWNSRWHGGAQSYSFWVENSGSNIMHHEPLMITKRSRFEQIVLDFHVPIFDSLRGQFLVRVISDSWVGVEQCIPVSFDERVKLNQTAQQHTNLLDLTPLSPAALQNEKFELLYKKFATFNPIQTQLFHVLYHTNVPVLLGAPTGSGKTIVAELALLRMKHTTPNGICVYIAPLKALARERLKEWQSRLGSHPLNWKVLELSGDTHHDRNAIERADVLVCTPEKWDLVSRNWRGVGNAIAGVDSTKQTASFVSRVKLLVLDEVHLLGEDRGAVLEAIVSRTRFISRLNAIESEKNSVEGTRIIGLSTTLANAVDLADWIGIDTKSYGPGMYRGLYNFRSSVRPVPIKITVQGFTGKHYCPRMASMNRPCYRTIRELSPNKPTLIFVASRRQTRLTAFDLISYAAYDSEPKQFLNCSETYIEAVAETIRDEALRHTIAFGIGLHHAGLSSHDRSIVEKMYLKGELLVLVATATLAWGINSPSHLVIVKGTEYFDGKSSRYVDFSLTDVMQMIGRAGRPGYDTEAVARVMCVEGKAQFYQKFLHTPFPVESCFEARLCENLNAEIASKTISSVVEAVGYLTWTFYARRVRANPMYYGAQSSEDDDVEDFLLEKAREALKKLKEAQCIQYDETDEISDISPRTLGLASANYYLLHSTPKQMLFGVNEGRKLVVACLSETEDSEIEKRVLDKTLKGLERSSRVDEVAMAWLLYTLCSTHEFDEHPVRHNEEFLNQELSEQLMWGPDTASLLSKDGGYIHRNMELFLDPHTKCFLLLQAYLEKARLPISDYVNDTKTVVENVPRLLAAMNFIALDDKSAGSFELATQFPRTKQLFETRSLADEDPLKQLPGMSAEVIRRMHQGMKGEQKDCLSLFDLRSMERKSAESLLEKAAKSKQSAQDMCRKLFSFPLVSLSRCNVQHEVDKRSGKSVGKLVIDLSISREKSSQGVDSNNDVTMTILLGSFQRRILLSHTSLRLSRFGSWLIKRTLDFDWAAANADAGEDGGKMVLRVLFDEIVGLDCAAIVGLQ